MNVEKAIKILRDTGVGTKLDYRYSAETLNAVKKIAIQSLREKAGRENGCKFCRNGEKTEHIDNDSLIKFWIYKDKLVVAAEIGGERIEFARKIKCCFECGRRLGGIE